MKDWLSEAPQARLDQWPDDLREHLRGCAVCRREAEFLHGFARDARSVLPSADQVRRVRDNVRRELGLSAEAAPTGPEARRPERTEPAATRPAGADRPLSTPFFDPTAVFTFLRGLGRGWAAAAAVLALTVLGLVSSWLRGGPAAPPGGPGGPTGQIRIMAGAHIRVGLPPATREVREFPFPLPDGETIHLGPEALASAVVEFPLSGRVALLGPARVQVARDGFRITEGCFVAGFRRSGQPFRITLPTAVLGVLGTTIRFALAADGSGTVEVLEGTAQLLETSVPFPSGPLPQPLPTGRHLRLTPTGITLVPGPAGGQMTSPPERGTPPAPPPTTATEADTGTDLGTDAGPNRPAGAASSAVSTAPSEAGSDAASPNPDTGSGSSADPPTEAPSQQGFNEQF